MNKDQVLSLLDRYNMKPRHEQGQNFLIDDSAVQASIDAAELTTEDTVLEIGPGLGVLTLPLAERAGRVVAIEQDRELVPVIEGLQKQYDTIEIINEDIRKVHLTEIGLQDRGYKLVSNLPYNITSWVMRYFTENAPRPSMIVVMVQKEVAQRITAQPGQMSVLSNAVQLYAEPEIIRMVHSSSFYPAPKVDSAVIRLRLWKKTISEDPEALMKVVKVGFASKRKQLHNNLAIGLQLRPVEAKALLEDIGLNPAIRAQELSLEDWEAIRKAVKV